MNKEIDSSGSDGPVPVMYVTKLYDDKVAWGEIWHALVRHKWLFGGVFSLVILSTIVYVSVRPPIYAFTSALEIGQILDYQGQLVPIEDPVDAEAIIKDVTVPAVMHQYLAKNPHDRSQIKNLSITVERHRDAHVIALRSTGTKSEGPIIEALQRAVLNAFVANQDAATHLQRLYLVHRKKSLTASLNTIANEQNETRRQLDQAVSGKGPAGHDIANSSLASLVAMQRSDALQQRLLLLDKEQEGQRGDLAETEQEIIGSRPTRIVGQPSRSAFTVGAGLTEILLVATLLGLLAATASVYISEIFTAVRRKKRN